jgi:hypothetical protein
MKKSDWREAAEFNWLVFTASWSRLHALNIGSPAPSPSCVKTTTECGRSGSMRVPGLFSRDAHGGLPRCLHCCERTGMPIGRGSPKNGSKKCRAIAQKRISQ